MNEVGTRSERFVVCGGMLPIERMIVSPTDAQRVGRVAHLGGRLQWPLSSFFTTGPSEVPCPFSAKMPGAVAADGTWIADEPCPLCDTTLDVYDETPLYRCAACGLAIFHEDAGGACEGGALGEGVHGRAAPMPADLYKQEAGQ